MPDMGNLPSSLGSDGCLALWGVDVCAIASADIASRVVVTNGEPGTHIGEHGAGGAELGSTADLSGIRPDDLGKNDPSSRN